jgi:two-component system, NtrC family, response regulator AtoC
MTDPNHKPTVLIVEDQLQARSYLEMALRYLGYTVQSAQDGEEGLNRLRSAKAEISAILLDLMLPDSDGMGTLEAIRSTAPDVPIIIVSGASSTMNVVSAMKCGATDFLSKPVSRDELRLSLSKALESEVAAWAGPEDPQPETPAPSQRKDSLFVGEHSGMKEIESLIGPVGWSEAPVLIQGETGTGKEVFARQLHAQSPRASQAFLKLNCAALPSELVESELFGYERGAFTGAFQKKAGMFEMADGGTILLDEIGDMDVRLQAKLLQVLQDHEFHRLGGKVLIKVNVRLLAATHRDLERAIIEGQFREDLYYRLNVMNFHLPSLRERKEDVVGLAEHLLHKYTPSGSVPLTLTAELKQALAGYWWPGNVRELENVIRRYVVLRKPDVIVQDLHRKTSRGVLRKPLAAGINSIPAPASGQANPAEEPAPILEQVTKAKQEAEAEAIIAALHTTRWNRKQAAVLLKIDYKALLYKMKKLSVDNKLPLPDGDNPSESQGSEPAPVTGSEDSLIMTPDDLELDGKHIGTVRFSSKIA